MIFEILELFRPLESAVAHRGDDLQVRSQGAQCHLESHLVVARRGAAVRHHLGLEGQGHLRNGLRLQHALRAHAQGIYIAPAYIAHDQKFQYLLKVGFARVDQMMFDRAQTRRAVRQRFRRFGIDAARIDGYRDDRRR